MIILVNVGPKLSDEKQDEIEAVIGEFYFHEIQTDEPEDVTRRMIHHEIGRAVFRCWLEITGGDEPLPLQGDMADSTASDRRKR